MDLEDLEFQLEDLGNVIFANPRFVSQRNVIYVRVDDNPSQCQEEDTNLILVHNGVDHLLNRPPLLDRGGFLLYNTYVRHLLFMDIKIYSSPGCKYCSQLKKLFERADITDYEEKVCKENSEMLDDYPNAASYPWVIIDGEEIGGLVETARYFLKIGLVTNDKSERT
ncbi:glutaredoxin [Synechococcus phage ACG-2014h]|uniref:Glutaredoxin n=1 Tax=Synechococcus phage ACG-2014h TaxID=1340810 RepID=V5UU27_9CAUD|nr:glutaredoxin [Synechococcus phage ACG-2014h]AHB80614.1 glutaredoxin [Synechococcus phage ACG-2014h]